MSKQQIFLTTRKFISLDMNKNKIFKFKEKYKTQIYLILIIILAFYLRTFNINWDNNYYFNPDERAIVMITIPLQFPNSIAQLLSPGSPLNPHFFAYGNFPLYLLKILGELASHINPIFREYGGIHIVGRVISAITDTASVFIVFLIGLKIFSKRTGLFSALMYALCVLPIQLSHFYVVDPLLTFFTTLTVLLLINFIQKQSIIRSAIIGAVFGLCLATKISAGVFIIDILVSFILIFVKRRKVLALNTVVYLLTIVFSTTIVFTLTQPYVLIDFANFLHQTEMQAQMSNDVFIFPYTLQYVGKIPYIYELKNMFFWGQGPVIFILNLLGFLLALYLLIQKKFKNKILIIFVSFTILSYLLIFGKFAVGWMRYTLPIYPLFCVFGGFLISEIVAKKIPKKYLSNYYSKKTIFFIFLLITLIYPVSFLSIYTYTSTRIQASNWINENIPSGKNLAVEHWDDSLPVYGQQNYTQLALPLYDPDTNEKWVGIKSTLKKSDYIILASNRLYKPLQKLTDCKVLPVNRCYLKTSKYYKDLFSGNLGFKKIAEFTDYPKIPFFNIEINDDSADESFTVNDHPKIIIFKKD